MTAGDWVQARTIGRRVFIGLVVATAVEFWIAAARLPALFALVMAVAIVKAWLIVVYFMHIGKLREEAE